MHAPHPETPWLNRTPYLCAAALFAFMCYLYVHVIPVLAWNGDDWKYLSQFRDMFPSLTRWNPARIFPEVLHPLVGWGASVIYALCGDYALALVWSHALLLATGVTALALTLHATLRNLLDDTPLALFAVALFMALSFSLFKSGPNSIFLFHSSLLTLSTFYVAPNLLNSILVCYLLYGFAVQGCTSALRVDNLHPGNLRARSLPTASLRSDSLRAGWLIFLIFLAQFSMTFGSAIAAVFAGWMCLWRLMSQPGLLPEKIRRYARAGTFFDALLLTIMAFWVLAAVLDMNGGRYARLDQPQWDLAHAWHSFSLLLKQINTLPLVVLWVLTLGALARFAYKRIVHTWSHMDSIFFSLFLICLLSALALLGLDLLISAKILGMCANISVSYNVFFCLVLSAVLNTCSLLQDMPRLRLLGPLVLLLLVVECQNAEKPWARQSPEEHAVVTRWLRDVREAEMRGDTSAVITVPKAEWPHPRAIFGEALSYTLFAHGFTARPLTITLRESPAPAPQTR